jgi:hypothetical protein
MSSNQLETDGWSPRIRALYDYWRAIQPSPGRLPGRRHFDPMAVPKLLPNIWLLDVLSDPLRFRYRLVGTYMVTAFGRDVTGLWFHEIYPQFGPGHPTYEDYKRLATERAVLWRRGRPIFALHIERCVALERIVLPLADDGATVDMGLGMSVHYRSDGTEI